MPNPRTPTAKEIFNALDILHGAPSPKYKFFGDGHGDIEGFLGELKKDCSAKLKRLKKREAKNVS